MKTSVVVFICYNVASSGSNNYDNNFFRGIWNSASSQFDVNCAPQGVLFSASPVT